MAVAQLSRAFKMTLVCNMLPIRDLDLRCIVILFSHDHINSSLVYVRRTGALLSQRPMGT